MLYKKIGDTEVPSIGQGTGGIFNPQIIKAGIDAGLTLIDTAESYGNETIVGEAIKGRRDKVFISTKFSPEHNNCIVMACENSLKRLGTDYIDLYSMHYPNPYIPKDETADALLKLKTEGKIRHIGVCNTYSQELIIDIEAVQCEYNLFDRTAENTLMPYCAKYDIAMMAYSPLRDLYQLNPDSMIELREMHPDKSLSQIILNWIISHRSVIALTSSKDIDHIKKNALTCDFNLSDDEIKKIDELFKADIKNIPLNQIDITLSADRFPQTEAEARTWAKWVVKPQDINLADFKPVKIEKSAYDDANRFPQTTYEVKEGGLRYWAWRIQKNEPIPSIIRHRWILDFKA